MTIYTHRAKNIGRFALYENGGELKPQQAARKKSVDVAFSLCSDVPSESGNTQQTPAPGTKTIDGATYWQTLKASDNFSKSCQ
jgi:hypothetical protein